MAVPTDFPEDVLLLDILLEQLLITVRQLMAYRRREAAANAITLSNRHRIVSTQPEESADTTENRTEQATRVTNEDISRSTLPLPDVVLETSTAVAEEKESDRTRTIEESEVTTATTTATETAMPQPQTWTQVGADLERITDQLMATRNVEKKEDKKRKMKREKDASIFSLLCPPLGGSVWTTVALLVGWGILSRTR